MGELMGFGPQGQPLTPLAAGLSPSDVTLYVKHVKAYLSQLPSPGSTPAGRGRVGRVPLRIVSPRPRAGLTVSSAPIEAGGDR